MWKILLAMVVGLSMVACPDPTTDGENNNNAAGGYTAVTGVYELTDAVANIGSGWGGKGIFSIAFMTDAMVKTFETGALADLKEFPIATPCYQYAGGNLSVLFDFDDASRQPKLADGGFAEAVTFTTKDEMKNYELLIDMSKLKVSNLKKLAGSAELALKEGDTANLTGYKPYAMVIKTARRTDDGVADNLDPLNEAEAEYNAGYVGNCWSADFFAMKKVEKALPATVAYPEEVTVTLKITPEAGFDPANTDAILNLTGLTVYKGANFTVDGSHFSWNGGAAVVITPDTDGATIEVAGTATEYADWVANQAPWGGLDDDGIADAEEADYPEGFDRAMKFGGLDKWAPYSSTSEVTWDVSEMK